MRRSARDPPAGFRFRCFACVGFSDMQYFLEWAHLENCVFPFRSQLSSRIYRLFEIISVTTFANAQRYLP